MIIKSFTAETAAAALRKVRETMGGDAVVLKIRQNEDEPPESRFELTALLDRHSVATTSKLLTERKRSDDRLSTLSASDRGVKEAIASEVNQGIARLTQIPRVEQLDEAVESAPAQEADHDTSGSLLGTYAPAELADSTGYWQFRQDLQEADLPEDYIRSKLLKALDNCDTAGDLEETVTAEIISDLSSMTVPGLEFAAGDRVVLVGPVASGKTSVLGKLAARQVVNGQLTPALASIDDFKVGAHEEMQGYADLLGLSVVNPLRTDPERDIRESRITLIDTPSLLPRTDKLRTLKEKIEELKPTHCLVVFSALMRAADLVAFLDSVKELQPTHLVATMLDLTDRYGSIIAGARAAELKLAYVSNTPGGIGAIGIVEGEELVEKMLHREVSHE